LIPVPVPVYDLIPMSSLIVDRTSNVEKNYIQYLLRFFAESLYLYQQWSCTFYSTPHTLWALTASTAAVTPKWPKMCRVGR